VSCSLIGGTVLDVQGCRLPGGGGYFGLRRGHSNVTPGLQDTGINDVLKFQGTGAIFATGKEWIIRGKRYFGPPWAVWQALLALSLPWWP